MQAICPLTGLPYQISHFSNTILKSQPHPIFNLHPRDLLSRARAWSEGNFCKNYQEHKLYFCALLNATGAVHFNYPANPSLSLIKGNMEPLLKVIGWYELISSRQLLLPHYSITEENSDLSNIRTWLESWIDAFKAYQSYTADEFRLRAAIRHREELLTKLIHSPYRKLETISNKLASWAMDVGSVPPALRDYWTSLFNLKTPEIYNVRTIDLEELLDHMEQHLYAPDIIRGNETIAATVLKHLRNLLSKNRAGLISELGPEDRSFRFIFGDEDFDDLTSDETISSAINILNAQNPDDQVIEGNETTKKFISTLSDGKVRVTAIVDMNPPIRSDFDNEVKFILAKIKYNAALGAIKHRNKYGE